MNADLARSLHPPRLPEAFVALGRMDLLAALGLGLLIAGLILTCAGPLLRRRPRRPSPSARIAATRGLGDDDRLLELARIAAELGVPLPADQRDALYRGQAGDPKVIEAAILTAPRHRQGRRC